MVKRSHELQDLESEADVPYEETDLARRALRSRPRLASILLVGAGLLVVDAAVHRSFLAGVGALALGAAAVGVFRGRLAGVIGATLAAALAATLPLALLAFLRPPLVEAVPLVVAIVLGLGALPDVVTLVRDAELQHAYGRWARRNE